jgi:LPS-assembly protein
VMRVARRPLATCRDVCDPGWRAAGIGRAVLLALLAACVSLAEPQNSWAQDPSSNVGTGASNTSAFAKQQGGIFGKPQKVNKSVPLYLQGDQLVYDTKGNRVIARGNVEIFYNNNILTADEVIYDQGANTLTAAGNVVVKEANGNVIRAERYTLTDDFRDGFVQSLSVVSRDESRITAATGERREGNVTEFSDGKFTACKSKDGVPPLWCVGAKKIIHDQAAATISYQDAWFEIYGQPVLYMPYFQHPDPTVKRRSGFLMPHYGSSGDLGAMAEVPYYFALSPNFDFTFHPRYLSKQGVLWQGDWRQKFISGELTVNMAGIDQDASNLSHDTLNRDSLDGWRGSLKTRGEFSLSSWWRYGWDVTLESDDTFRRFYKLDSVFLTDRVNKVFFNGMSDRSYFGANLYHFGGLLVSDTAQSESAVHPIIDYNYVFSDPVFGGELSWDTNVMSFSRSDVNTISGRQQDINRAVTEFKWRRRLTDAIGITYTPFAELRGDVYQLSNYINPLTGEIEDDTVARGLATGGAIVSYPWVANATGGSHVVEPIGQIIVREGSVRQHDLPDEDARSLIFDDTNLFETTKFSGYDRLETGIRANVGLQYTFQANKGGYARVLAGQSYHIKGDNAYANPGKIDPNDTLYNTGFVYSPENGLENDKSDYILAAYLAPTNLFHIIAQARFDEDDLDLKRQDITANFSYGPLYAQATYAYTALSVEQAGQVAQEDIVAQMGLRLTDRWNLSASIRYDIDDESRLSDSVQLAYLDECFMLSATYSETFINDPLRDIEPDRTVMLRFELKHLGGFNYSTNVTDVLSSGAGNTQTQ